MSDFDESFKKWCFESGLILNKRFFDLNSQCDEVYSASEAWNHQQQKIDAVLNYLKGCECSLDVDIDSIKELLK